MLAIVTGTPGAGKTLWTVSTVDKQCKDEGRPVYYYGIEAVTLDNWIALDDPKRWHECPEGSFIIFDEAYAKDVFPPRKVGDLVPEHVEAMATHRHRGHDVYVICQHSTQIDTFVRKMAAQHHHFKRLFGAERSTHYEWMELANERDKWERKEAQRETFKYPTEYYGTYKSTSLNTSKRKLPKKMIGLVIGGAVLVPLLLFAGLSAILPDDESESQASSEDPLEARILRPLAGRGGLDEHIIDRPILYTSETNTPEVRDIPYSATLYDKLIVPVSYPKISGCMRHTFTDGRDECSCNSQQGTKLNISYRACVEIVNHGFFDFSKEDRLVDEKPAESNDGPPLIHTRAPEGQADGVAAPGA